MPVNINNETVQNIRLCNVSLRAIPGIPWVEVLRLNSRIIERRRWNFGSGFS